MFLKPSVSPCGTRTAASRLARRHGCTPAPRVAFCHRGLRPAHAIADPKDFRGNNEEDCRILYDREGNIQQVMCGDYGFRSGTGKIYEETDGSIPKSMWELAITNFQKEWLALRGSLDVSGQMDAKVDELRSQLAQLTLDDKACWELERKRDKERGENYAPVFIKIPFYALCWMTDNLFDGRPIQRFWFLEEVARMPYMVYISMMHLYESLGWFRAGAPLRKVHFAEEWNEMHHLMIMESLGGDQAWIDRFLAQHAAVFYFWLLCLFYAVSPQLAYKFSVLVEGHAIDTYGQFAKENEERLKQLPAPYVAAAYYLGKDLYMLDAFTLSSPELRRPSCSNLYEVFINIHDDEVEHEHTMSECQANTLPKLLQKKENSDLDGMN